MDYTENQQASNTATTDSQLCRIQPIIRTECCVEQLRDKYSRNVSGYNDLRVWSIHCFYQGQSTYRNKDKSILPYYLRDNPAAEWGMYKPLNHFQRYQWVLRTCSRLCRGSRKTLRICSSSCFAIFTLIKSYFKL